MESSSKLENFVSKMYQSPEEKPKYGIQSILQPRTSSIQKHYAVKNQKSSFDPMKPVDFLAAFKSKVKNVIQRADSAAFQYVLDNFSNLMYQIFKNTNHKRIHNQEAFYEELLYELFCLESECSLFQFLICNYM